jgi:hypothetical protein
VKSLISSKELPFAKHLERNLLARLLNTYFNALFYAYFNALFFSNFNAFFFSYFNALLYGLWFRLLPGRCRGSFSGRGKP